MSYSCEISFKQMSPTDIIEFQRKFKQHISDHISDIAKDNYSYCPYIRKSLEVPYNFSEVSREDKQLAEYWARTSVFQYRYFYDTERQLLGMYGVPQCAKELFDGTVYFQNSCDQDYEKDAYDGIKAFETIVDKWQSKTDAEILKDYVDKYGESLYDSYDISHASEEKREQKFHDAIEYHKRTAAYDEIWESYENTLYNDDNAVYLSLYGYYDFIKVSQFVKACHDAQCEWQRENDRIYQEMQEGQHPELKAIVDKYIESHSESTDIEDGEPSM